jgi:hypothetical protein
MQIFAAEVSARSGVLGVCELANRFHCFSFHLRAERKRAKSFSYSSAILTRSFIGERKTAIFIKINLIETRSELANQLSAEKFRHSLTRPRSDHVLNSLDIAIVAFAKS